MLIQPRGCLSRLSTFALNAKLFACVKTVFKRLTLDASYAVGLSSFE